MFYTGVFGNFLRVGDDGDLSIVDSDSGMDVKGRDKLISFDRAYGSKFYSEISKRKAMMKI